MDFTVIERGELYTPEYQGPGSLLVVGEKIGKVGVPDNAGMSGAPCAVVDASNCMVVPGLLDPHAHLIGAGGEAGFASQMPQILFSQLINTGVTTVVGLLGSDIVTRYLPSLHANTKYLPLLCTLPTSTAMKGR
jgi:beta-aspartyl-dipeptidase (metallo-type)